MSRLWCVALGLTMNMGLAHAEDTACPAITDLTSGISEAIAEAELEQASALAAKANTAAFCQPQPHQTMLLAQLFRMSGAAAYFKGDMAAATQGFTLAASISPGEDLEAAFGQQAGAFYSGIRDKRVAEAGASIKLLGDGEAWIDGRPLRAGVARDITAGPHILQTRESGGTMEAKEISLTSGEEHVLELGAAPAASAAVAPAPSSTPAASGGGVPKSTLMRGGGGALIAAGAGMLFIASGTHSEFDDETDPSRLEGLQSRTNSMATMGLVAGVAGIGLVGASTMLTEDGVAIRLQGRW